MNQKDERRQEAIIAVRTNNITFLQAYLDQIEKEERRSRLNYRSKGVSLLGEAIKWNALRSARYLMKQKIKVWMHPLAANPLFLSAGGSLVMFRATSQYYADQFADNRLDTRVIDAHVEHACITALLTDQDAVLCRLVHLGLCQPWSAPLAHNIGGPERPYLWHLAAKHDAICVMLVLSEMYDPVEHGLGNTVDKVIDTRGRSALHYACEGNAIEAVGTLLHLWHADVEARSYKSCTPLHIACHKGNASIVAFLCRRGAKTQTVDGEGMNALHHASDLAQGSAVVHALQTASPTERLKFFVFAVVARRAGVCPDVAHKICAMAKSVCPGINAIDKNGLHPLARACTTAGAETMLALLGCKAAPQHRVDAGRIGGGRHRLPLYNMTTWHLLKRVEIESAIVPPCVNRMLLRPYITSQCCPFSVPSKCRSLYTACLQGHYACAEHQITLGDVSNSLRQRAWNAKEYVASHRFPMIRSLLERTCGPRGPLVRTWTRTVVEEDLDDLAGDAVVEEEDLDDLAGDEVVEEEGEVETLVEEWEEFEEEEEEDL